MSKKRPTKRATFGERAVLTALGRGITHSLLSLLRLSPWWKNERMYVAAFDKIHNSAIKRAVREAWDAGFAVGYYRKTSNERATFGLAKNGKDKIERKYGVKL